jgi:hypothetical protein
MLEIVLLIGMWKGMGKLLEEKGRSPILFQIGVIVAWFAGAFFGGIVGAVIAHLNNEDIRLNLRSYLIAFLGAAAGAGFIFLIAACLPQVREDDDFDEERFRRWQEKRRNREKRRSRSNDNEEEEDERRRYTV